MGSRRHTNTDLRSASFSEYVNNIAEDCARCPGDSLPEYELPIPVLPRKLGPREHEIDVFDAKKYFNMNSDVQTALNKEENHILGRKSGAPIVIPETGAGITNPFQGSGSGDIPHQKKKNQGTRRPGILFGFSCSDCCLDAKSVQVSEESQAKNLNKTASVSGSDRTAEFEFPILNAVEPTEKQPWKSLDLFGLDAMVRGGGDAVAINLERKLSMQTWDAIPKARTIPVPPRTDATHGDEVDSCASSDLFEIESIPAMCRHAALRPTRSESPSEKEIQKRCSSSRISLLGCKSQKSVNVAEPEEETRPK
ncbi:uncharacterized protein LOC116187415 [Punica granatum]|uniref:Protein PHYTOCHROME KINASE SUBSTRATE 1-like n=2 Tax=Punica granatum TaxID=22663 RepID=A0A218Y0R0_PUNGR|nr:uncharacterized protein LOC116187415 [Punica granatum]OWM90419.1 hypothetical protein CDL15_Pgr014722 [Punica granatum]PKI77995.1 hypothetical protein CRG98_001615 [Punica granatum]